MAEKDASVKCGCACHRPGGRHVGEPCCSMPGEKRWDRHRDATPRADEVWYVIGLHATVLAWLQSEQDRDAAEVLQIRGEGSNWAGDTENGFYTTFRATIDWRRVDGTELSIDVDGAEMASLWDWVIKGRRAEGGRD